MSVKTALTRWFPAGIVQRIAASRKHSMIPDSAWRWWGFRHDTGLAAEDMYEKVGWAYACVRAIARNAQQVPFVAVRNVPGRGNGRVQQLPDSHPLAALLKRPNDTSDWSGIIESTITHLQLRGEGFWELDGVARGANGLVRPARMFSRPPQWVWKVDIKDDDYQAFHMRLPQYAGTIEIPGERGVLLKYFNPRDPYRGLSPARAAFQAADTYYAAMMFNAIFFEAGGLASMVVGFNKQSAHQRIDKSMRDRIRAEFQHFLGGLRNARKIAVLDPGMEILSDGTKAKEMDFAGLLGFCRDEISAVYGVPPIILGHVEHANRSNSDMQRQMFWREVVVPNVEDISQEFNLKIAPRFGDGCYVLPDFSQVPALRANFKELGDAMLPWIDSGAMYINEVRRKWLDLDPVPWGDEPFNPQSGMNSGGTEDVGSAPENTPPEGGKLTPESATRLLEEWKNATLSRVLDGAKEPYGAFPVAHEARKAVRKFGLPRQFARELARAVSLELAVNWDKESPADRIAEIFDQTIKRLPPGREQGAK